MVQPINEQHRLYCYSEVRSDLHGLDYHVEYVRGKSRHPGHAFGYQNFVTSALDSGKNGGLSSPKGKNAFGGHTQGKQDVVNTAKFIHYHVRDCSHYFACLSDGRIVPADELDAQGTENAQYAIDLLNLSSGSLQTKRRNHWEELEQLFDGHIEKDWDLQQLLQLNLVSTPDHKLHESFSIIRQFFQQEAEQVLQSRAPALV